MDKRKKFHKIMITSDVGEFSKAKFKELCKKKGWSMNRALIIMIKQFIDDNDSVTKS